MEFAAVEQSASGGRVCQVSGCGADLSGENAYHRRHRVCPQHAKAPQVTIEGRDCRYCQQCGHFHDLSEFTGGRRSCEASLQAHRARRAGARAEILKPSRCGSLPANSNESGGSGSSGSLGRRPVVGACTPDQQGLKRARLAAACCDQHSHGCSSSSSSLAAALQQLLGEDACTTSAMFAAATAAGGGSQHAMCGCTHVPAAPIYPAPIYSFGSAHNQRVQQQQQGASGSPAGSFPPAAVPMACTPTDQWTLLGGGCGSSSCSCNSNSSGSMYTADVPGVAAAVSNAHAEHCKSRLAKSSGPVLMPQSWQSLDLGPQPAAAAPWMLHGATPAVLDESALAAAASGVFVAAADAASASHSPAAADAAACLAAPPGAAPAAAAVPGLRKLCLAPWANADMQNSVAPTLSAPAGVGSSISSTLCTHNQQQQGHNVLLTHHLPAGNAEPGGCMSSGCASCVRWQPLHSGSQGCSMLAAETAAHTPQPAPVVAVGCPAARQQQHVPAAAACACSQHHAAATAASATTVFGVPPAGAAATATVFAAPPACAATGLGAAAVDAAAAAAAAFGAPPVDASPLQPSNFAYGLQPQGLQLQHPGNMQQFAAGCVHSLHPQQLQLPVGLHTHGMHSMPQLQQQLGQQGQQQQLLGSLPLMQGVVSAPMPAWQPQWQEQAWQEPPMVWATAATSEVGSVGHDTPAAGAATAAQAATSAAAPAVQSTGVGGPEVAAADDTPGVVGAVPPAAAPATVPAIVTATVPAAGGSNDGSSQHGAAAATAAVFEDWEELVGASDPDLFSEGAERLLVDALDMLLAADS